MAQLQLRKEANHQKAPGRFGKAIVVHGVTFCDHWRLKLATAFCQLGGLKDAFVSTLKPESFWKEGIDKLVDRWRAAY